MEGESRVGTEGVEKKLEVTVIGPWLDKPPPGTITAIQDSNDVYPSTQRCIIPGTSPITKQLANALVTGRL